jgi:hypothetical protein
MSQADLNRLQEVENAMMPLSAREDAEVLAQKVTLLEGELVEVCRAWEVAEEKLRS